MLFYKSFLIKLLRKSSFFHCELYEKSCIGILCCMVCTDVTEGLMSKETRIRGGLCYRGKLTPYYSCFFKSNRADAVSERLYRVFDALKRRTLCTSGVPEGIPKAFGGTSDDTVPALLFHIL
jgi:hypothetical protein